MINIKRQSTLKTKVNVSKKEGVQLQFERISNASLSQSHEEIDEHVATEGFVLPNGEYLYLKDIQKAFAKAFIQLIREREKEGGEIKLGITAKYIVND